MNKITFYVFLLLTAVQAGCSNISTPAYDTAAKLPEKWDSVSDTPAQKQVSWWKDFNDPQLNKLIDKALLTNNDFAAALVRVRRAELIAGLVDTNLTPSVTADASTTFSNTFNPPAKSRSNSASLLMSYELDLWGKLASQREAAGMELNATDADCQAFALSLLGTTARLYWQLAYLNQSLELNEVDLESAEKTLAMAKLRYESGSVSELSVVQAEMNLLTQQNFRGQLLQQRVEARNALAILFNQPPQSEVVDPPKLQDGPLPAVAAGIPAEILANRPDLHAAELRLRAALVNIDVTRSSFYPTFSLTGFLGATSTSLQGLPQNSSASASLGLSLPFLQWNTAQLTIRVSKTQYEEALLNFRQRLYSALMEVENNLAGRLQLMDEEKKLTMLRAQAQRADSIARTRFEEGYTDIQPWLDAQASLRNAEHSVLLNRMNQMNNLVNLNKALGLGATSSQIVCSAKL